MEGRMHFMHASFFYIFLLLAGTSNKRLMMINDNFKEGYF